MSASASSSLINIDDFSYIIIDIGSIGMTEFIHTSVNRYVDEFSVEAQVISGQYSVPELLDSIHDCVKTYTTNDLLSQIREGITYVVTDTDLGNFLQHKLVVYFPDRLGHFYDLLSLIDHINIYILHVKCPKSHLPKQREEISSLPVYRLKNIKIFYLI